MTRADEPLRALSLWHPWAAYTALGGKDVENRSWHPADDWTGEIAIHAGLSRDARPPAGRDEPGRTGLASLAAAPAQLRTAALTPGAIIAVVTITGYHRGGDQCGPWCDPAARWHWDWSGAVALPVPVPVRGERGLWTLPPGVAAAVRSQLRPSPA